MPRTKPVPESKFVKRAKLGYKNRMKKVNAKLESLPEGHYLAECPDEVSAVTKLGRPCNYDRTLHPFEVLKACSEGCSREELCLELGLWPYAISDWEKKYPDFALAIKIGEKLSRAWWLSKGRKNLHNPNFNNTLWMMNMSNRFGWTRRVDAKVEANITETKELKMSLSLSGLKNKELESLNDLVSRITESTDQPGISEEIGSRELLEESASLSSKVLEAG